MSSAPGTRVGTTSIVHNGGEAISNGAVLLVNGDHLFEYAGDFSNCNSTDFAGALCTFDEELEPGKTYRVSTPMPFQFHQDARTGASLLASSVWWTRVSGKKYDVVQVWPSFTNLGPALLEWQSGPLFRVTIPQGTTAGRGLRRLPAVHLQRRMGPGKRQLG